MELNEIKERYSIVDEIGKTVQLKKKGQEYVGICPFHDDHKSSLSVNEEKKCYKCFACGAGGDIFDFYTQQGLTLAEAKTQITGGLDITLKPQRRKVTKNKPPAPKQEIPTYMPSKVIHKEFGEPSSGWKYHNKDGQVMGYVFRFDLKDGEKQVLPYTFRKNKWSFKGFDSPRPLYNLHLLTQNPNAIAIVVEGEKTAEAVNKHLDNSKAIATCWIGGGNSVGKTDFSALNGRPVRFIPDNDIQGLSAMLNIWHLLNWQSNCKIVPLNTTKPKGWDLADQENTEESLIEYIKANSVDKIPENAGENIWKFKQIGKEQYWEFGLLDGKRWSCKEIKQEEPPITNDQEPSIPDEVLPPMEAETANGFEDLPTEKMPATTVAKSNEMWADEFKFLGFEKSDTGTQRFYFYANRSQQVICLAASAMTKSNLLLLAPIDFWEQYFPGAKGGFSSDGAANFLIDHSLKTGIFNPDKIRGRGGWIDGKNTVFHCGQYLLVNGKPTEFTNFNSIYIYEAGFNLGFEHTQKAPNTEASKLLTLCQMLNWEKPINAYLLAGWCVVAPFCGALPWRPHIWITGGAGAGKTWVVNNILKLCLGQTALAVESDTTEAGIRQYLQQDALPVVFDEAEGEDKKAQERMQNVLALMRGSSSSTGGFILKGSGSGQAIKFRIRSAFAYSSIGVQLSQASDKSRVSVLGLLKNERPTAKEEFETLTRFYHEHITEEFVARLQNRTISNLKTVIKNCKTFANAASVVLGGQREGDQVGALLAGAYSLISDREIDFDTALNWIKSRDFERTTKQQDQDEIRLFYHLMERMTIVELEMRRQEVNVGQLVQICLADDFASQDDISKATAKKRLAVLGFKVENETLYISNTADFVKKSLRETPWSKNHTTILKRINGAEAVDAMRFGSGVKSRAVAIPINQFFNE